LNFCSTLGSINGMLQIELLTITDFAQNCRIIADTKTKNAIVVDPGGDVRVILSRLKERGWLCQEIWLTHCHIDHCGGVKDLKDATSAKVLGHRAEVEMRAHAEDICRYYGIPLGSMKNCPEPDQYIEGGETLNFCGFEFKTLFTPGHSPGHIAFYNEKESFVLAGDALFAGSIGRTDLPGGDTETLLTSIRTKLLTLPDNTRVLSGHGEDTTVGEERRTNPFLQGD